MGIERFMRGKRNNKTQRSPGRPRRMNQGKLDLIADRRKAGFTSVEIGNELGFSRKTIEKYMAGTPILLQRKYGLERKDLVALLYDLILKFCNSVGQRDISSKNYLALKLNSAIDKMDALLVDQLRANESERNQFLFEFVTTHLPDTCIYFYNKKFGQQIDYINKIKSRIDCLTKETEDYSYIGDPIIQQLMIEYSLDEVEIVKEKRATKKALIERLPEYTKQVLPFPAFIKEQFRIT